MRSSEQPQRPGIPTYVIFWRFFTGLHMDGKTRQNYRTGHVLPQYRDYAWNRLRRWQRAWWRLLVMWSLSLLGYGLVAHRAATVYLLVAAIPFVVAFVLYRTVGRLTTRVRTTTPDGVPISYRSLRPKYYRRLERVRSWRFRLRPPNDHPMPPDWEKPVKAQLAEDGQAPVTSLRLPGTLDEVIAQNAPRSGRGATYRRNAKRRLGA